MSRRELEPLARFLRRYRRRPLMAAIILLVVVAALALADRQGWLLIPRDDINRYDDQVFALERVIDGDTIVVDIPDPTQDGRSTRVRLWGINAPELRPRGDNGQSGPEPWAEEATERARGLLTGQQVRLDLEPHRIRDRYGRLLAYVELPDGTSLGEQLLVEGLVRADDRWPHRHVERYRAMELQAQKKRVGMWER